MATYPKPLSNSDYFNPDDFLTGDDDTDNTNNDTNHDDLLKLTGGTMTGPLTTEKLFFYDGSLQTTAFLNTDKTNVSNNTIKTALISVDVDELIIDKLKVKSILFDDDLYSTTPQINNFTNNNRLQINTNAGNITNLQNKTTGVSYSNESLYLTSDLTNNNNLIHTDSYGIKFNRNGSFMGKIGATEPQNDVFYITANIDDININAPNGRILLTTHKVKIGNGSGNSKLVLNDEVQNYGFTDERKNEIENNKIKIDNFTFNINDITTTKQIITPSIQFSDGSVQNSAINNSSAITTNANNIVINTNNIVINTNNIVNNSSNIVTNANNIANNSSDIVTNANNITNNNNNFNLLSTDVGSNIQRLDALELENNTNNSYNYIQSSKTVNWYSVKPNGVAWGTNYAAIDTHAHNLANNSPAPNDYYDNNGQWDAGTKKLLITFESVYTLEACHVTKLKSKLYVLHSGHAVKGESIYMGYNLLNNYLVQDTYTYNGQIIITVNNGDYLFLLTDYHIQTGSGNTTPYDCQCVVNYTELYS